MKRTAEIVVISDLHLGTRGCRAKELLLYLKSVSPEILILNGDIIDIWQFSKSYFPKAHMKVVREILKLSTKIPVYYLTGNHDEALRKFSDFKLGNLTLCDKLVLELDGKKHWFFHGDIFDATMKHAKWLAKLGAVGYDSLIAINCAVNWVLERSGRERMSFSKKIKNSVKSAVSFISAFEDTAAEIAIDQKYHRVICGHIHQPALKKIKTSKGEVEYLNSGDWIENLSALEYKDGEWELFLYDEHMIHLEKEKESIEEELLVDFSIEQLREAVA